MHESVQTQMDILQKLFEILEDLSIHEPIVLILLFLIPLFLWFQFLLHFKCEICFQLLQSGKGLVSLIYFLLHI